MMPNRGEKCGLRFFFILLNWNLWIQADLEGQAGAGRFADQLPSELSQYLAARIGVGDRSRVGGGAGCVRGIPRGPSAGQANLKPFLLYGLRGRIGNPELP
jgi:hypothetical protein